MRVLFADTLPGSKLQSLQRLSTGDDTRTLRDRYNTFAHALIKLSNLIINSHTKFQDYGKEQDGSLAFLELLEEMVAKRNVRKRDFRHLFRVVNLIAT